MFRPENILLAGFTTYVLVLVVAPLTPVVEMHAQSLLFVGLCCAAFWAGSGFESQFVLRRRSVALPQEALLVSASRLFNWMFALGAFGNMLRLVDKYIIRGVGGLSGLEAREVLVESGSSIFSLVGGVFYPFGYIPIFLYLGLSVLPRSRVKFIAALVLFLIPAIDALTLYSRSFMLVSLSMIYFGTSIAMFRGKVLPARLVLPMAGAFGLVVLTSVLLFSLRLDEMDMDILDSIFMSGYGYTIVPNAGASSVLEQGGIGAAILSGLLPIAQYFTHSMFEFQILWESADWQTHSYGKLHFYPYVKVLSLFGVATLPDLWELFPRVGIFTSFLAPCGWISGGSASVRCSVSA